MINSDRRRVVWEEDEKKNEFKSYDDTRDFIVHCSECNIYRHLKGDLALID